MNTEELTWTEIERRVRRLQDKYGSFPVYEETVENDPDYFEHGRQKADEGWIGDAGVWVTDDGNRMLLIRHADSPKEWGIPGGGHEPGETMEETASREVQEETGIECTITRVNFARRKTIVLESEPTDRYHMLTVIFDAKYEQGETSIDDEEILEVKWFSELPDNVLEFVQERVVR